LPLMTASSTATGLIVDSPNPLMVTSGRAHNPQVAGSNPAPATGNAPAAGPFRSQSSVDSANPLPLLPELALAALPSGETTLAQPTV
jgi:hypothetical protein